LFNQSTFFFSCPNQLFIRDIGSSSGTFLNSFRLSECGLPSAFQELNNGDRLQLGEGFSTGGSKILLNFILSETFLTFRFFF